MARERKREHFRRRSRQAIDSLSLGRLAAVIERVLGHPRLLALRLEGDNRSILAGLAQQGRPIQ
jgi:S-adenosylmethionine:tRNA ribosyltransferase-isomerase